MGRRGECGDEVVEARAGGLVGLEKPLEPCKRSNEQCCWFQVRTELWRTAGMRLAFPTSLDASMPKELTIPAAPQ